MSHGVEMSEGYLDDRGDNARQLNQERNRSHKVAQELEQLVRPPLHNLVWPKGLQSVGGLLGGETCPGVGLEQVVEFELDGVDLALGVVAPVHLVVRLTQLEVSASHV